MRGPGVIFVVATTLTGLGWSSGAIAYDLINQVGTVSATADRTTVTDELPPNSGGNISVTAGSPNPNTDYAKATLRSQFAGPHIQLTLFADVDHWGNEGKAESHVAVQFSVDQDTEYSFTFAFIQVIGNGHLGHSAFVTLSNDDGVIWRKQRDGGVDPCNFEHPDADTLCTNQTLTPGEYTLEAHGSTFAPGDCFSCKGYATNMEIDIKIKF